MTSLFSIYILTCNCGKLLFLLCRKTFPESTYYLKGNWKSKCIKIPECSFEQRLWVFNRIFYNQRIFREITKHYCTINEFHVSSIKPLMDKKCSGCACTYSHFDAIRIRYAIRLYYHVLSCENHKIFKSRRRLSNVSWKLENFNTQSCKSLNKTRCHFWLSNLGENKISAPRQHQWRESKVAKLIEPSLIYDSLFVHRSAEYIHPFKWFLL